MSIDNITKRIGKRSWAEISDYWQETLASITFPISEEYDETEIERVLLRKYLEISEIERTTTIKDHYLETPGLRSVVFSEAVILMYKGLNSLKSAQCDQLNGYKTWSINNYYEASYLFCKTICALLGIELFKLSNSKFVLVDIFPEYAVEKRQAKIFSENAFSKIHLANQFEHTEVWALLKRLICITRELSLPQFLYKKISALNSTEYGKQRNRIIYINGKWIFDDLKKELIDANYGIREVNIDDLEEEDAFTIIIAFQLAESARKMFSDLSAKSKNFMQEFIIIQESITNKNNFIYSESIKVFV